MRRGKRYAFKFLIYWCTNNNNNMHMRAFCFVVLHSYIKFVWLFRCIAPPPPSSIFFNVCECVCVMIAFWYIWKMASLWLYTVNIISYTYICLCIHFVSDSRQADLHKFSHVSSFKLPTALSHSHPYKGQQSLNLNSQLPYSPYCLSRISWSPFPAKKKNNMLN